MSRCVVIAKVEDVPAEGGICVRLDGQEFAVFNSGGQFYVLDGCCPHRGGPLGSGIIENGGVHCPLHGWKFDLRSGVGIDHPEKSVKSWPIRLENGTIQIIQPSAAEDNEPPAVSA